MILRHFQAYILVGLVAISACKRKETPNKIIDGVPVNTTETIVPAQAAQEFFLLKRDGLGVIVPVINRLSIPSPTFPELTGPSAQTYSFTLHENHYGTANFTIQFRDSSNNPIDPITTVSSTNTLQSVAITVSGNSTSFSYTENLVLTLVTQGNVTGKKLLTGTSSFNGSSYSIVFTLSSPGSNCTFNGFTDGSVSASGSGGPSLQPTSLNLIFSADHKANGNIAWEGLEGGIHFEDNGSGIIVTNQFRLLID